MSSMMTLIYSNYEKVFSIMDIYPGFILILIGSYVILANFTLLNIVSIPIAYNAISNKVIRNALIVIFIFMQLVGYAGFLNDDTYNGKFDVFKTIFTQLWI